MTTSPKFSIITTCRARLAHLKTTLPAMLKQSEAEVIVVDFSCPEGTAAFVTSHYPAVKVVKVEGKDYWSQCEARNAGAAIARGDWLIFCDADITISDVCTKWLSDNLKPGDFGKFQKGHELKQHRAGSSPLGGNALQGFQVIERSAFEKLKGYDHRLRGYAAGDDTEFYRRAFSAGHRVNFLDESIIASIIHHDDEARTAHTKEHWLPSYLRGTFYGHLKMDFDLLRGNPPPDDVCDRLIEASANATAKLMSTEKPVDLAILVSKHDLTLAAAAGYPDATIETVLTVRINLKKP
jgi:glycosyltransferase involved in cell wall biosynthesis